jgi:hypothetical protein
MAQGKTLWEMFTEWWAGPVELQFFNPLRSKIGSPVTIDDIEWRDHNFFVRELREYKRTVGGRRYLFADYVLVARSLEGKETLARLRINPVDDPDRHAGRTHNALLLQLYDDLPYSEDLHRVVNDTTKKFQVLENGQVQEEYVRIHDVGHSYKAVVAVVKDANQDKKVKKDEVERLRLEYWDYGREVKDAAGQPLRQYLFVEMDRDNGWFQIWRGHEIDPRRVVVLEGKSA